MLLLIRKDLIQMMHHLYRSLGHALLISSQPDQHVPCILIDGVHQADLVAALRDIALVDAHLIRPQSPGPRRKPHAPQRIAGAFRQRQHRTLFAAVIANDMQLSATPIAAPDIRDGFVVGLRGEVLDAQPADERVPALTWLQREDADRLGVCERRGFVWAV